MSNPITEQEPNFQAHGNNKPAGVLRIWKALFYSLAGIKAAYLNEAAFRQEIWLSVVLVPAAIFFPVSMLFKLLLVGSIIFVLVVELLNSAVEALVDKVMPDYDVLAKRAKDMGSAAVFLALVNLVLVWSAAIISLLFG